MFTDIEGSTELRTTLGDVEADALLREHDALIRREIEEHQGRDQKAALGDGFLALFISTRRALTCAIGIQRALDSFNLGRSGAPLRVRIGLNTGEVAWQGDQLSGEAVHAAARVCAEATGGQILVSDVTRQLAGTVPDVVFHDAGEHQLKGFPEPWRLWDVVWVRETTQVGQQVFVEREAEMAMVRSKLGAALKGNGGLVLVGGEPGVGKTTLVRQLIREAEHRGALAVFGRCYESEGAVPYSPFVEMLEQALAIMPPDIVRADMGDDAAEVARMVPELRRRFPDIGEPLELPPEQQRRYFFNAVAAFIARGSARFPLVLVLDDVHWADEPTLLLLEHMAAQMPELRVLGVGTYRDVELELARPLAATLERLVRARNAERLSLKRFDRAGVAVMLAALAGKPAPDAIVDAVFDETEGNPFFVEEVFWHLAEEGKIFDDAGEFRADLTVDELDVPESVRLVVGRRLERLGTEAQKVLAAGAVVGRAFPFALLGAITDTDGDRLLDILEDAEAAKVILAEESDGDVHYSFAHELIRQTLLSGLSLLRRQRLHLAIADAIEHADRTAPERRPSEIAHHLLLAGAGAQPERTLTYLERTADRAMDAAAFEEALRAIDDALALVAEDEIGRIGSLLERKGWTVRALGRFEECIGIWERVIPIYQRAGNLDTAAHLCWEMGYQLIWLNRFAEAFAKYATGIELLGDQRNPVRAELVGASGALLGLGGSFDQAETAFAEAMAMAEEFSDDRALGRVLWGRTMSYWSASRAADGVGTGRAAIEHLRRSQDLWLLVDALAWTSYVVNYSGAPEEGRVLAAEAVSLGMRLGHRGGELLGRRGVSFASTLNGIDLDALEVAARADLDGLEAIRSPWVSQSHAWLATILTLHGDLDAALRCAETAIALEPASAWTGLGWSAKFINRAMAGDREACRLLLAGERSTFPEPGEVASIGRAVKLFAAAQGCAVVGLLDEAAELYPLLVDRADALVIHGLFDAALSQRVAGMAAAAAQQWDDAQQHFSRAQQQSVELPSALDRPQVLHWHAQMLLERGDPKDRDRARVMLAEALHDYETYGMPILATQARALLSDGTAEES
jgi:tetratricopeptide (TPR) repeat protein